MKQNYKVLIVLYILVISLVALAMGFSDAIFSNYFNDAYHISAQQRGFIEIPRETPGILAMFVIAILSRFGDIKIACISQLLCCIAITLMGISTPHFYVMCILLFFFSMGQHIFMPLTDSIAMSIVDPSKVGRALGKFKGIMTFFSLIAASIVWLGFNQGFFSFTTSIKWVFIAAAILYCIASFLLAVLANKAKALKRTTVRPKLIFKKKYTNYYILAIMNGVQKQIVLVYAPWVIIEILQKGADTTALLLIISSICGIIFMPFLGYCIDHFGVKKMLYADALSFILVYLSFAFIVYHLYVGNFSITGWAAIATFVIFIIDRMSSQMGIIRSVYLKSIVKEDSDILPTISLGITLDHIVAIICSYASGMIWMVYGPHYIFILAALLSLVNLFVAKRVNVNKS